MTSLSAAEKSEKMSRTKKKQKSNIFVSNSDNSIGKRGTLDYKMMQISRRNSEGFSDESSSENADSSFDESSVQIEENGDSSTSSKSFDNSSHFSVEERNISYSEDVSDNTSLQYSSFDAESEIKEHKGDESTTLLGASLFDDDGAPDIRKRPSTKPMGNAEHQNDTLEFWQKKYASNQNEDINRLVEDALTPSAHDDGFKVVTNSKVKWNVDESGESVSYGDESEDSRNFRQSSSKEQELKYELTNLGNDIEGDAWQVKGDFKRERKDEHIFTKNSNDAISEQSSQFSGSPFSGLEEDPSGNSKSSSSLKPISEHNSGDQIVLSPTREKNNEKDNPSPISPYGKVLDESQLLNTVNSDITSSILNGESPSSNLGDWAKRPHLVIAEKVGNDVAVKEKGEGIDSQFMVKKLLLGSEGDDKSLSSITSSHASHIRVSKESLKKQIVNHSKGRESPSVITEASRNDIENSAEEGVGSIFMSLLDTFSSLCSTPDPVENSNRDVVKNDSWGRKPSTDAQSLVSAHSTMNKEESKKWDEWNKKGEIGSNMNTSEPHTHTSIDGVGNVDMASMKNENNESNTTNLTHIKDFSNTGLTLTTSSQEQGGTVCTSSPSRSETSTTNNDINLANSSTDKPRAVLGPTSKFLTSPPVDNGFSLNQYRIFENFCDSLRYNGIEVLKQNREAKWQARYLTLSKEQTEICYSKLNNSKKGSGYYPNALLWVKRFNRSKDHSISLIDKQGRGGVLLKDIVKVISINTDSLDIPRKFQAKYHESTIVLVEYKVNNFVRSMALRCISKNEAHFFCTGLRACIDILKRENEGMVGATD